MRDDYTPRDCVPMQPGMQVEHPSEMPELVHMQDPATAVFTDFRRVPPGTIAGDVPIDEALNRMKVTGACMLLVTDSEGAVAGMLTADQCCGDAPVRLAESSRVGHGHIRVGMVMMPLHDIRVLEWPHMKDARVGHIVATLNHLECRHLLVVDHGRVRGVFSASQIARQVGHAVTAEALPAHSLAEIVHTLG